MFRNVTWIVVAAVVIAFSAGVAGAEDGKYIGVKKCKSCHKKELIGDQYKSWTEGPHAKAFETLTSDDAIAIGKEKGLAKPPSESDECLKCHATAFGLTADQLNKPEKPLKLEDGVQCETCHGPGSGYKGKKTMSDHDKSVAKGMLEPDKNEDICTACHNDESPTWDAEKGFDFEKRKEEIAHKIPEDVKGKYIELSKKKDAE